MDIATAIIAIRKEQDGGYPKVKIDKEDINQITWYDDNPTSITNEQILAKQVELRAEYDTQEYARNRKLEYDVLNQFELMTDDAANSTTSHATAIGVIKTKWPKDNSGPVE